MALIVRTEMASWLLLFVFAVIVIVYAYTEIRHAHLQWIAERDRYRALRNALLEAGIRVELEALEEARKPTITIEVGVFCCEQGIDRLVHHGVPVTKLKEAAERSQHADPSS